MAGETEVRLYRDSLNRNPFHRNSLNRGATKNSEWIQINHSQSSRAEWFWPGPVRFEASSIVKALQPYAGTRFQTFDDLLSAMKDDHILVTDFRSFGGTVHNIETADFMLAQGYVVERYNQEICLIKRLHLLNHREIWMVADALFWTLKQYKLISRDRTIKRGSGQREIYQRGPYNLSTLDHRKTDILQEYKRHQEQDCPFVPDPPQDQPKLTIVPRSNRTTETNSDVGRGSPADGSPLTMPPLPEIAASPKDEFHHLTLANIQPVRRQRVSPDLVVALDDEGQPITMRELNNEGKRTQPRGLPVDLLPDAGTSLSDDEWERLMLIEQVKFRRRTGQG